MQNFASLHIFIRRFRFDFYVFFLMIPSYYLFFCPFFTATSEHQIRTPTNIKRELSQKAKLQSN